MILTIPVAFAFLMALRNAIRSIELMTLTRFKVETIGDISITAAQSEMFEQVISS